MPGKVKDDVFLTSSGSLSVIRVEFDAMATASKLKIYIILNVYPLL